jgi:hypothetical protein
MQFLLIGRLPVLGIFSSSIGRFLKSFSYLTAVVNLPGQRANLKPVRTFPAASGEELQYGIIDTP